jgi:uncharacterized protein (DUF2237 family)
MTAIVSCLMRQLCFVAALLALLPCPSLSFVVNRGVFTATHGMSTILRMAEDNEEDRGATSINVLGTTMVPCCSDVGGSGIGTGFYRNGYCSTGEQDLGRHTVCIQATDDFLTFSASVGNDLSTAFPEYMFPGLKEGDIWCLCAQRWAQAYNAGKAPKLFLRATHEKTLDFVPFEILREYALDAEEADATLNNLNEMRAKLNKLL